MATTASFKQQCPSCEAWVPIRDSGLIGRKIDCPKCKYRFLVEEPPEEVEADDDEDAPKKKGKRGDDEEDGGRAARGKGKRRGGDDDDAAGGKKGMSTKLLAMIGIGVVAVALLAVVGYFIFGSDSPPTNIAPRDTSTASTGTRPAQPEEAAQAEKTESKAAASASLETISNMIHPEAEGVCNIRLQDLIHTELGRTIFDTPGAFRAEALRSRFGFPVEDIEFFVQAWNFTKNWTFTIVHTSKPIKADLVKAALRAKSIPDKEKIEDQDYFLLEANPWLDQVGRMSFAALLQTAPARVPSRSGSLAMRLFDDQTLVFADVKPLQDFLTAKGRFPAKAVDKKADAQPEGTDQAAAGPGGKLGGMQGMMGGGQGGGRPGGRPTPGSSSGLGRPATPPGESSEPASSANYLTVDTKLKSMLDRVEKKRPVISLALDLRAANDLVAPLSLKTLDLQTLLQDGGYLGAGLQLKDGLRFTMATEYQSKEIAIRRYDSYKKDGVPKLVADLSKGLNTNVEEIDDETSQQRLPGQQQPGANQGGMPGGMMQGMMQGMQGMMQGMQGGGMRPGAGARGGPGGRRGGAGEGDEDTRAGGRGGRGGMPGLPGGMPGMMMPGMQGMQRQPGAQETPKETKPPGATVQVTLQDESMILIAINIIDPVANSDFMNGKIRHMVLQQKGYLDMAGGRLRIHELAKAARTYPEAHQAEFPRGTAERPIPGSRAGRPYPPDQRVSWMVQLLPYLGPEQGALFERVNLQRSWRDPENVIHAATLIPQFLDPQNSPSTWWVKYPTVASEVAATHYVGIAGVGLDAAEYSAADAAVANKIGVFGYDRSTRLADIKDGSANTILMAEVPPTFKRPWLAGGGSTVMGVPEKNSIAPFVSSQRNGKRGTQAIFADGSVRFISESISDDVFKAMCTIKGGESITVNRDAPLVPPPSDEKADDTKP